MRICPICVKEISNWSHATGKAVKINGIFYHINCLSETKVQEIIDGKWQPIKAP